MPQSAEDLELKVEETHIEQISVQNDRIAVTDEDSKRIVRKTDLYLLSLLAWVYFLQILDKVIIGYAAVFGLKEDTGLVGNQYSTVGSIGYYAQMAAQPIGAYVLVKFPVKFIMPIIVTCWGCALCGMAGANNFSGLMAGRFFLGFFEAMCLPLFSLITSQWYRRVEQPMRVATWFGTNGIASIIGSLMAYGLSFIESDRLHNYQVMFLLTGGMTVVTGPALYWLLDNGPGEARFLTPEDRLKAVERLRSNNTGTTEHHNFKWEHVFEMITEMRGYMFFGMVLIVNMGASTTTVFGPLILKGMLGFTPRRTMLLNIPFGALQLLAILSSSWIAVRFRTRAYILFAMMVPVVAATAILYAVPRETAYIGGLLTGYYLLAFLFSAHPLLISWIISNTAGQTKKATYMASYNFSASLAHIFNPYIFKAGDEPHYIPGLRIVMIVFCILILLIVLTAVNLMVLNKRKEGQRERNGKTGKLEDLSMAKSFDNKRQVDDKNIGQNAMLDMTDRENDEFQYVI